MPFAILFSPCPWVSLGCGIIRITFSSQDIDALWAYVGKEGSFYFRLHRELLGDPIFFPHDYLFTSEQKREY